MENNSKENLKIQLDRLASEENTVSDLQKMLQIGPKRKLVVGPEDLEIHMTDPLRVYAWKQSDPRTAIACLVAVGEYEPLESVLLKEIAKRSKVVVDIGANVGYYSVELGKELQEGSLLLAIEPVPETVTQLELNLRLNNLSDVVQVFKTGVGRSTGSAEIFIPETSGSSAASTRNLHGEESHSSQAIPITTLDKLISDLELKNCDLIKIDVEGAELLVLEGSLETIKRFKPVIFAELLRKWSLHFAYHPNSVMHLLKELGYQCWGVSPSYRLIEAFTDLDEETNFIFIHKSDEHGVMGLLDAIRI